MGGGPPRTHEVRWSPAEAGQAQFWSHISSAQSGLRDESLSAISGIEGDACRVARREKPLTTRIAPAKLTPVRIVVDLNRCQGYGQCVFLAPGVFELHGEEALMYDPGPDETQRLPVVRAAAACPVQAIHVEKPDERA
jgi:ferredoxin